MVPPIRVSATDSKMNWPMMWRLRAPIDRLMPISFVRSLTTTYMMLATPTPATSSVNRPTRPRKISIP